MKNPTGPAGAGLPYEEVLRKRDLEAISGCTSASPPDANHLLDDLGWFGPVSWGELDLDVEVACKSGDRLVLVLNPTNGNSCTEGRLRYSVHSVDLIAKAVLDANRR